MKKIFIVVMIGFVLSCSQIKTKNNDSNEELSRSRDLKSYVTPIPHYVLFSLQNSKELNLSSNQLDSIRKLEAKYHPQGMAFVNRIQKAERKIKKQSKMKASKKSILETYGEIEKNRLGLAKLKLNSANKVRSILSASQLEKFSIFYPEKMKFDIGHRKKDFMAHANPVPNYVGLILRSENLELTKEQRSSVEKWKEANSSNMSKLVLEVVKKEKEINMLILAGASDKDILRKFENVQNLRERIVNNKTQCRDYIAKTLSKAQWSKLVDKN